MMRNDELKAHLVTAIPVTMSAPPPPANPNHYVYTPLTGRWRDDWWNCFANFWPSCGCVSLGGPMGVLPVFLSGQISSKIGLAATKFIMMIYLALVALFYLLAFIIAVAGGSSDTAFALIYCPIILAYFWFIFLRFRFVDKYQINEDGCMTCLIGFFCNACSLCQMARHQYGYTRHFDGDGLLDGNMVYPPDIEHGRND